MSKLSELIKERLQSTEVFCFKFPFRRTIRQNSLEYLDDQSYGVVRELLGEFVYAAWNEWLWVVSWMWEFYSVWECEIFKLLIVNRCIICNKRI